MFPRLGLLGALSLAAGCSLVVSTSGLSGGATAATEPDGSAPTVHDSGAVPLVDAASTTADVEAGPAPVPGLVGAWNFDDGTAADSSGQRHDGALAGDATAVASDHGKSLQFSGFGSMTVDSLSGAAFPASGTFAIRFKWTSMTVDNQDGLLDSWEDGRDHLFFRHANGDAVGTMQVAFQTPGTYVYESDFQAEQNTWVRVVFTWDTTNRKGAVFVDGTKAVDSTSWTSSWKPSGQHVTLGSSFHGLIDDVRLYDRVLPDAELTAL